MLYIENCNFSLPTTKKKVFCGKAEKVFEEESTGAEWIIGGNVHYEEEDFFLSSDEKERR